ncbi:hypothetical protein CRG98_015363 [Punica granatum]|uniref:S-protein homolog n=1 Tax=Punica granatum TaxID=22663 RepID=A0A2I0K811_PUNGR|nr:hypothetical protein CRG98_015363 [Punica granatum]
MRVKIYYELPKNASFIIHSKSGDDDLGSHVVGVGKHYGFGFRANIWGTALFFCRASWQGRKIERAISSASRDEWGRCLNFCIWQARDNGILVYRSETLSYLYPLDVLFRGNSNVEGKVVRIAILLRIGRGS